MVEIIIAALGGFLAGMVVYAIFGAKAVKKVREELYEVIDQLEDDLYETLDRAVAAENAHAALADKYEAKQKRSRKASATS